MNQENNKPLEVILANENNQKTSTKSSTGASGRHYPKKWEGIQHDNVKEGMEQTEDNAIYGFRQDLTKFERHPWNVRT